MTDHWDLLIIEEAPSLIGDLKMSPAPLRPELPKRPDMTGYRRPEPRIDVEDDFERVARDEIEAETSFMDAGYALLDHHRKSLHDLAIAARHAPWWNYVRIWRIWRAAWIVHRLSGKILKRLDDVREKNTTAYGYMRLDDLQ